MKVIASFGRIKQKSSTFGFYYMFLSICLNDPIGKSTHNEYGFMDNYKNLWRNHKINKSHGILWNIV